jgi:hypothetical protein
MVDWNDPQIKLIVYLIYGSSFIILFLVMTIWKKRIMLIELMNGFKYLAAFGLLHGLAEYSDIPRLLTWQPAWIFDIIKLILVSSSFAALFAFGLNIITTNMDEGRWWLRGLPYGALFMYFWLLIFVGLDFANNNIGINYTVADLAERYSLGFLGAALSSYAFLRISGKMSIVGDDAVERFIIAGYCFSLYAVFGGLIVTPIFGVPIIVYRSIIALLITISVIRIFQLFQVEQPKVKQLLQ